MLELKNVYAKTDDKEILKGLNLTIKPGEVHAIMGPNGSGKSTFSKIVAGHPNYTVTAGEVLFQINGKITNISQMEAFERAREGIFLGMQYPIEIPGVTNFDFMYEAFKAQCEHQGAEVMNEADFRKLLQSKLEILEMRDEFLDRSVNEGFSGGEKKKNEILQMMILNPRLSLLDEIDSGLDIDALKIVSKGINSLRSKYHSVVLVTHYQRLLDYVEPDFVHILAGGKIVKSGNKNLALELEKSGYDGVH
jgi:Fe-S cluster assembly ATP-binding protein